MSVHSLPSLTLFDPQTRSSSNMIHLDIIKYILNPLLNWDDCLNLSSLIPATLSIKKHYSQVILTFYKVSFIFDDTSLIDIEKTAISKRWYKDGVMHREDLDEDGLTLPALIIRNGTKVWYKNDKQHNSDKDEFGLTRPAVIHSDDSKSWWKDGQPHRTDKDLDGYTLPSIIYSNGTKEWWTNGKQSITIETTNE